MVNGVHHPSLLLKNFFPPGISDQDNWHGKPIGAKSEEAIKAIQNAIVNQGPHNIIPKPPTNLLGPVKMSVQLSDPPAYKLGDAVGGLE